MLVVEDLMLLLLDDETGTPAAAGTLPYTLGGAVLVELALLGRIEADSAQGLNGPKVYAVGDGPLEDPLLQEAYDKVAEKPRGAQTLLLTIGSKLWDPVVERLIERGLIRREKKRVLGLFKMTMLPAADTEYEAALRDRIRAVLVDGAEPDPRTAALIALLSSSGALPQLRPQLAWSSAVIKRAKELEQGNWGAVALDTVVTRTAAAIAVSTAVAAVTVTTPPSS
ncbi:GPP34 family phosphoprotein [Actinoplanes sp. LDG1-06]|uniref:GPP34 family phosphoprotein n=1 Tax=Paractinoplanes ovalisporus TaxID=2810368 RepID=A0ABS2AK32_9ACTN|nr:GPP34 family phosphoprotein [Actinoplanes ovalisporus]MBM2619594.1 GPP34 family phosphoprotein [Actinoplanes ovalisporus]